MEPLAILQDNCDDSSVCTTFLGLYFDGKYSDGILLSGIFSACLRFILKLELGHNFVIMDLNGIRGLMFHNKIVLKWEK